jgi:hypothetical protein
MATLNEQLRSVNTHDIAEVDLILAKHIGGTNE